MSGVMPGDVVAGKFRVERVLGEGGMGYVVAATHLQLGQVVALKFMRDEVCTPEYKRRFMREARNTVRLKSKHVSRVLDVGALDGGAPYMVMEYLEGTDLSALLHARGPLPVSEACEYILQACEAISEAHGHGIVHRDLKPANLFLTRGATGEPVVKVLDFGVSKVQDLGIDDDTSPGGRPRPRDRGHPDSVVTRASDLLGSPSYMAPEQVVSARDADVRSDVWSLGVILYRLMTGKAPFQADSLGELIQGIMHGPLPNLRDARPDAPVGLEHVVARCLERDRERRPSVAELARLLAPYAGPVVTPSLERIAILGDALVTAPPAQGSSAAFSTSGRGWTSGAVPEASSGGSKPRPSGLGAALWGGLVLVAVSSGAMAVSSFVKGRSAAPRASASVTAEPEAPSAPARVEMSPTWAVTLPGDEAPQTAAAEPAATAVVRKVAPREPAPAPEPSAAEPSAAEPSAPPSAAEPAVATPELGPDGLTNPSEPGDEPSEPEAASPPAHHPKAPPASDPESGTFDIPSTRQ